MQALIYEIIELPDEADYNKKELQLFQKIR